MKTKAIPSTPPPHPGPGETAIREYAYQLYELSGREPGRDLDNWLEASAFLRALPPTSPTAAFALPHMSELHRAEAGHVHAAVGHARSVGEQTAHTVTRRNA